MLNTINTNNSNLFHWKCRKTWLKSAKNTLWCLIGCSIGDFGTILFFQFSSISISTINIMILAIINGILTSIILETLILYNQMTFLKAFRTAIGMSFISMLCMEIVMNGVDWILLGEAKLTIWIMPLMLICGFISAWPYNYFNLKKYNVQCH